MRLESEFVFEERGEADVARSRGSGGPLQDPGHRLDRTAIVVAFAVVQGK